jgi:hypothetical protein
MVNINSKSAACKRVREAQLRANEARVERARQNVDGTASFLVELGRLAAVEQWEELASSRFGQRRSDGAISAERFVGSP